MKTKEYLFLTAYFDRFLLFSFSDLGTMLAFKMIYLLIFKILDSGEIDFVGPIIALQLFGLFKN